MRIGVYAIYDSTAEVFMRPMYMVNDAAAIRGFINAMLNPQTEMFSDPGDFTLFKVEHWDDVEGKFSGEEFQQNLGNGLKLLSDYKDERIKVKSLQNQISQLNGQDGESANA